jgi:cell division control protein 6
MSNDDRTGERSPQQPTDADDEETVLSPSDEHEPKNRDSGDQPSGRQSGLDADRGSDSSSDLPAETDRDSDARTAGDGPVPFQRGGTEEPSVSPSTRDPDGSDASEGPLGFAGRTDIDPSRSMDDIEAGSSEANLDGIDPDPDGTNPGVDGTGLGGTTPSGTSSDSIGTEANPPDSSADDPNPSQGLFDDLLSGEPIFENKEVLRPSYTPRTLPHREDQINNTATILVAALRGETPSNILMYGKTGTGKTASAKYVSQELESTSRKYDVPCTVEYINCEVTDTQYRVLARLSNTFIEQNQAFIGARIDALETLGEKVRDDTDSGSLAESAFDSLAAVTERIEELKEDGDSFEPAPMTGWPTDRVYSTFFEAVDYRERVVVIMLDEIDKLVEKSGDDTLYNLSRMNSELDNSRVSIMGISNDLKFTDFLDPRVKSSLGEEEIVFPPYDANQLRDILAHRSDLAFEEGVLTDDVIPLCAAFAAQEHGDARRALDLLRTAGELTERSSADRVEGAHVRRAQEKIELDRVVEVVRTLPTQSKLVLFAIISLENNGVHNITTGEVFNIYRRLCGEIDADVLTQRRVTDLISELDMLGIVSAVVVSKGRYGRTKEISLSVPTDKTEHVLLNDSRLSDLQEIQPLVQSRFDEE